jgi:hypothetical protein
MVKTNDVFSLCFTSQEKHNKNTGKTLIIDDR